MKLAKKQYNSLFVVVCFVKIEIFKLAHYLNLNDIRFAFEFLTFLKERFCFMIEVRFHGRAGQGIVTAAELLAHAVAMEEKFSQAFPFFGSEKRGPPVASFCRIDDKPIKLHEQIYEPDIVVVADASIFDAVDVCAGLKKNGTLIINTNKSIKELGLTLSGQKVFAVDGNEIAMRTFNRLIVNTVMLGALAKATGIVKIDSIKKAIDEKFSQKIAEPNKAVVSECFDKTCNAHV